MAQAFIGYTFGFVEPNATVGVYLHGFPPDVVAAIDVRAQRSPSHPGAFDPAVEVDQRRAGEHVDGTLAHTIWAHNVSVSKGAPPIPVVSVWIMWERMT
jgi:hypothetical protein